MSESDREIEEERRATSDEQKEGTFCNKTLISGYENL